MRVLRRLPERRLESYTKDSLKVSGNSVINIRDNYYSVPSQLIGERVDVRIYAGQVEVWYAGEMIQRMERLCGEGKAMINYRHIIHSLVKKPGAFAHYRFRASLFPRVIFRLAYDELQSREPGQADREYLQLLKLAAEESEDRVAAVLHQLLNGGESVSAARVREMVLEASSQAWEITPSVRIEPTPLKSYDQLLYAEEVA